MRERPTARVLLFDSQRRILLMKGRLPGDPAAPGVWFTIGGGVEPGETLAEAAAREIFEETGFLDATLGPLAWFEEVVLSDRVGPLLFKNHYLIARCAGGTPSREGWRTLEREFIDDMRWWRLHELAKCQEPIFPPDLTDKIAQALLVLGSDDVHRIEANGDSSPPILRASNGEAARLRPSRRKEIPAKQE
jgi:8-oxo-dGTP pyrophosphatase MutT (NUDIX family)